MNIEAAVPAAVAEANAGDIPETLGELVRQCAERFGDRKLGYWFEDDASLSYRELDEMANRLAGSLLTIGIRKGTHVSVMLPNTWAFPITWVALARIGAVMIPVNTSYTSEELNFVLTDSDSQFFVVDETLLPAYSGIQTTPPLLSDERIIVHGGKMEQHRHWQTLVDEGSPSFVAPSAVCRNDLLNIQYTSGTTGFPKGCMLTHDWWMLMAYWAVNFRSDQSDIKNTLIWAPFYYMDPLWQFLMTMRLGATANVARRFSLSRFYDWLTEFRINYCIFPEPALKARPPSPADRELDLKYISIYGWREESRREVQERFGVVAREGYGMTEIGGATVVPEAADEMALKRTCGLPAPFRELKIVDENGNEVPDGERGELWVAGRSILWGYYKRPEANADNFRGKWFRTGDIFYRDEGGYYYIVGRIKDMIKRAGENISAHEVEKALCALDCIAEAAVLAVPDPLRREEVKAYLLLKEGLSPEDCPPEKVVEHCRTRLAPFKIPRYIAYVSEFPRTASRKIQKRKLIADIPDLTSGAWDREKGKWL